MTEEEVNKIPENAPIRNLVEKSVEIDGKQQAIFTSPSIDDDTLKELMNDPGFQDFLKEV